MRIFKIIGLTGVTAVAIDFASHANSVDCTPPGPAYGCCCVEGTLGSAPPSDLDCTGVCVKPGDINQECIPENEPHRAEHTDADCIEGEPADTCYWRQPLYPVPGYICVRTECEVEPEEPGLQCHWEVYPPWDSSHSYAKCSSLATMCP
jgi:hypothetical protein